MKYILYCLVVCIFVACGNRADREQPPLAQDVATELSAEQLTREAAFTESMNNVELKGYFTMRGKNQHKGLAEDSYIIYSIEKSVHGKSANNIWKMEVGIAYGTTDIRIPLYVPIEWAGDTPVICITDMMIPGLGTYSARVLFDGAHYAGTWDGDGYGGELFGQIIQRSE